MSYWVYELNNRKRNSDSPIGPGDRLLSFQKMFVANTYREAQAKAISWADTLELPFKVFYVDLIGAFDSFPELPLDLRIINEGKI